MGVILLAQGQHATTLFCQTVVRRKVKSALVLKSIKSQLCVANTIEVKSLERYEWDFIKRQSISKKRTTICVFRVRENEIERFYILLVYKLISSCHTLHICFFSLTFSTYSVYSNHLNTYKTSKHIQHIQTI